MVLGFMEEGDWRHAPELSIKVAGEAARSRVFPLYEVFNGDAWQLSPMPDNAAWILTYNIKAGSRKC